MKAIVALIKNPELGRAKTRLAATIGDQKALLVYKLLLDYTREVVEDVTNVDKWVFYSRFIDKSDDWTPSSFNKESQLDSSNLGQRINAVFKQLFEIGYKQVVIIGSDCAELEVKHLECAFKQLDQNDVVLGPCVDGGYYLIGSSSFIPELIDDVEWSTEKVFSKTVDNARVLGKTVAVSAELCDIDDWETLQKYGGNINWQAII